MCKKHLALQQQKLKIYKRKKKGKKEKKKEKTHTFSRLYPFSCCRMLAASDFYWFCSSLSKSHFCKRTEKTGTNKQARLLDSLWQVVVA